LRKLTRFSVRLSQLQDIGGCRIIFETNVDIDIFIEMIKSKLIHSKYFTIERITDYREKGRDDSGYRAVHLIIKRSGVMLELQIRSRIQHNWAELIERTSVIYGHYLKELDGDPIVLDCFKSLSNIFHEIESNRKPADSMIREWENKRLKSKQIIAQADTRNILNSSVNESFIKSMIEKEASLKQVFHNWMIIFNWQTGNFKNWTVVSSKPEEAIKMYADMEREFRTEDGFEVVMIGSSDVSSIRKTHSHYFGIDDYDNILQSLDDNVLSFTKREHINADSRLVLQALSHRDKWGIKKRVNYDTLKNHFCKNVNALDKAIEALVKLGLVIEKDNSYALNTRKKNEIKKYL
jgi:ppGpp synthetase/RelA/SpoT-type nucleotidyltranferase